MGQANIYRSTIQSPDKADAYKRIEQPLEKAGPAASTARTFSMPWSQVQARIHEMNELGWTIESVNLPKHQWQHGIRTANVLRSKPLEVAPGEDWYSKLKGKPRPGWQPRPFSERRVVQGDYFALTPPWEPTK
jgi:hypothetical protein